MIEIKDGLNENDVVVLNPKSLSRDAKKDSSKAEKPDAPTSPSSKKKTKSPRQNLPNSNTLLTTFKGFTHWPAFLKSLI